MKNLKFMLSLILPQLLYCSISAKEYNILEYGAVADTAVLSTPSIQKAIDQCSAAGGGRVVIPAGHFKTGTIILKSNVDLHLENGAVLFGSRNLGDYIQLKPAYVSLRTQEATIQLIYAENTENVSITGHGEIDGQGSGFKKLSLFDEGITRPHLLRFITCKNVSIENITLRNSGCWMQHYLACDKVQIRGIRVFNRNNFNNDALDLDGCRNVTVSDFISDSDDDGITLKSTSPRPCENIVITNCVVSSRCNAIKLGTETNGGFKNICISNCVVKPSEIKLPAFYGEESGISGIALEIVDGGTLEGVSVSNIQISGTQAPIFIRLGNRARPYLKNTVVDHTGSLGDVTISNVRAKGAGKTGCSITGQPGFPVRNIRLSNIVMELAGGGTREDISKNVEEKPKEYPEVTMFGTLPAYGFYIRHATGISLDGIKITTKTDDARPVLYLDDVQQSSFGNIQFSCSKETDAGIFVKSSHTILFKDNVQEGKSSCFLKSVGEDISGLLLLNNVIGNADEITIPKADNGKRIEEKGNVRSQQ